MRISDWSSDVCSSDLTETVRTYIASLADAGLSPRTAARRLSALRQFFRFLYTEGLRADDPCAAIDSPRQGRSLPKILTEPAVDALLAEIGRASCRERVCQYV